MIASYRVIDRDDRFRELEGLEDDRRIDGGEGLAGHDLFQADDGSNVFCVPMASVIHGFIYNKEVFEGLGLKQPKTNAEFYQVLDAIKQAGEVTPMALGTADQWE